MKRLGLKHGSDRLGRHRRIRRGPSKTRERIRAMTHLRNGLANPVDADHAHDAAGGGGNDRLMFRMGLQRQHLRAIGFHQHVIGQLRQFGKRKRRRGKFARRLMDGPDAHDGAFRQRGTHLVKRRVQQHGTPIRHEHLRAGGDDDANAGRTGSAASQLSRQHPASGLSPTRALPATRQLAGQRAHERGLPAGAYNGNNTRFNIQQLAKNGYAPASGFANKMCSGRMGSSRCHTPVAR